MRNISDTIVRLQRLQRRPSPQFQASTRMRPLGGFGSNPGDLNAWVHVPESAGPGAPLVVVLHGCTQTAAGYDESAGWSRLADRHGFVVLYPEQQRSNNPNLCFNWFSPADAARGRGEARSIRDMVAAVQAQHQTDPKRIYVTGLSAGGAMAAVMGATYPDVFAGVAVIAGLPFGVAQSVPEAFDRMRGHGGPHPAALSGLVRDASGHSGSWPTLSVWHGSADQTVSMSNASALIHQWRGLHGVPEKPSAAGEVAGNRHRVWRDGQDRPVIEEYIIGGLAHGTPLDSQGSSHGEKAAPFMLDAGISSTLLISRFWGIVGDEVQDARPAATPLRAEPAERPKQAPAAAPHSSTGGIGKTIEDALRSAGLMK